MPQILTPTTKNQDFSQRLDLEFRDTPRKGRKCTELHLEADTIE